MAEEFVGFYMDTIKYYEDLANNNTKEWFDANKGTFEKYVMRPSRIFVTVMGEKLREIAPNIIADPRVNKSIFKIHRDTRFSKDKTPYKTQLAIWFWEGTKKRMECSGFYFQLEPSKVLLGAGIYLFEKLYLEEYRNSVVHPVYGPQLEEAIRAVEGGVKGSGGCAMYPGERYKKVPRGFDPNHERADLLLNKGLIAFEEAEIPKVLFSYDFIDYCFSRYERMAPIHRWLVEMTERVDG
jgi:uncharacterized protein (TIGR02453 family)